MLYAIGDTEDGRTALMLVLEPANIELMKMGQPVSRDLKADGAGVDIDLLIAYTPDLQYVREQLKAGVDLDEALKASLTRKENWQPAVEGTEILDVG